MTENFKIFSIERIRSLDDESRALHVELEILIDNYGIEKIHLDKSYPPIISREMSGNLKNILKNYYKDKMSSKSGLF